MRLVFGFCLHARVSSLRWNCPFFLLAAGNPRLPLRPIPLHFLFVIHSSLPASSHQVIDVNGDARIGLFARSNTIAPGDEVSCPSRVRRK